MNLLHPTLGDLLDRSAILELKYEATGGYVSERAELEQLIAERSAGLSLEVLATFRRELRFVHRQIWNINEQFAYLARAGSDPENRLGLSAWRLNQQRIAILQEIDILSGEFLRPEKVY